MPSRFRDPLIRVAALAAEEIYAVCPRCSERAVNAPLPGTEGRWQPRRLVCPACGYSANWTPDRDDSVWGDEPIDPFFRLPLWFQAECCGGRVLWAFNGPHLDLLENYVAARLRERGEVPGSMSLVERLPAWMKSAKHREEILRAIRRLRAISPGSP